MNFEWDEAKAEANLEKHRLDFSDAVAIFAKPHLTDRSDRDGEARSALGTSRVL
jgi:uncharacterized protein